MHLSQIKKRQLLFERGTLKLQVTRYMLNQIRNGKLVLNVHQTRFKTRTLDASILDTGVIVDVDKVVGNVVECSSVFNSVERSSGVSVVDLVITIVVSGTDVSAVDVVTGSSLGGV